MSPNEYRAMLVHGSRDEVVDIVTVYYAPDRQPMPTVMHENAVYGLVRRLSNNLFLYRIEDTRYARMDD